MLIWCCRVSFCEQRKARFEVRMWKFWDVDASERVGIRFRAFTRFYVRIHTWLSGKSRLCAYVVANMASDTHARWVTALLERQVGAQSGALTVDSVTCLGERQDDGSTRLVVRATWRVNVERPPGLLTLHARITGAEFFPLRHWTCRRWQRPPERRVVERRPPRWRGATRGAPQRGLDQRSIALTPSACQAAPRRLMR